MNGGPSFAIIEEEKLVPENEFTKTVWQYDAYDGTILNCFVNNNGIVQLFTWTGLALSRALPLNDQTLEH